LRTVNGAMMLLNNHRVCNLLSKSIEFIDDVLLSPSLPATINESLETFADVIVSIEYYFDTADSLENLDESVLKIAEESLIALGYEV